MSSRDGQYKSSRAAPSVEQIRARGEVKVRTGVLWLAGIISGLLGLGGLIAFFVNPEQSKNLWVIIGPIIAGAVSGSVGFLSGVKSSGGGE